MFSKRPVEQSDRDAAADLQDAQATVLGNDFAATVPSEWLRSGEHDDDVGIQAFARYRLALAHPGAKFMTDNAEVVQAYSAYARELGGLLATRDQGVAEAAFRAGWEARVNSSLPTPGKLGELVERFRELEAKATKGKWKSLSHAFSSRNFIVPEDCTADEQAVCTGIGPHDAALIVFLRNEAAQALTALAERLGEAERVIERQGGILNAFLELLEPEQLAEGVMGPGSYWGRDPSREVVQAALKVNNEAVEFLEGGRAFLSALRQEGEG